jgi:hypothetical protein
MYTKRWRKCVLMAVVAAGALLCGDGLGVKAQDLKGKWTIHEGKAATFKGKEISLEEKGHLAFTLVFPADKKATVTIKSKKETDINLYVYDSAKKLVAKDDSPGPSCDLNFTPKEEGRYILEVVNMGPGSNVSTIKVEIEGNK